MVAAWLSQLHLHWKTSRHLLVQSASIMILTAVFLTFDLRTLVGGWLPPGVCVCACVYMRACVKGSASARIADDQFTFLPAESKNRSSLFLACGMECAKSPPTPLNTY